MNGVFKRRMKEKGHLRESEQCNRKEKFKNVVCLRNSEYFSLH